MPLHNPTILFVNALICFLCASSLTVHALSMRTFRNTFIWVTGFSILGISTILYMSQGNIPSLFSIYLANLSLVAGKFLITLGARRFLELPKARIRYFLLLLSVAFFLAFEMGPNDGFHRTVVISLAIFICDSDAALSFKRSPNYKHSLAAKWLFVIFAASAVFFIGRLGFILQALGRFSYLLANPMQTVWTINLLIMMAFGILICIGMLSFLAQRQQFALQEKSDALQASIDARDQLFTVISHDLRGSIGAINSGLNYIQTMGAPDPENPLEFIDSMSAAASNAYSTLEDLLLWVEEQKSELHVKREPIAIDDIVANLRSTFKFSCVFNGITLETNFPPNLEVAGDRRMLISAFRNLVGNSLKFTPPRGVVRITARKLTDPINTVEISVSDNGTGIPIDVQKTMFESNRSETRPGIRGELGTGAGLRLVNSFIKKNQGTISLASQPGSGTEVTVRLPSP